MSARARLDAMRPKAPSRTRTADPRPPDQFWTRGNYLGYVAFGSTGVLMILVALGILRAANALGRGEAAWNALMESYSHPLYLWFHAFALAVLTWFALRFFRVFPKTQPPTIGPLRRPPLGLIKVALNGGFVLVSLALALVLGGALP
jgi:fumarate reductase subunit C